MSSIRFLAFNKENASLCYLSCRLRQEILVNMSPSPQNYEINKHKIFMNYIQANQCRKSGSYVRETLAGARQFNGGNIEMKSVRCAGRCRRCDRRRGTEPAGDLGRKEETE